MPLVTSTKYAAPLQQAIAQTTTPTKKTKGNAFLTYENNSTLGVKKRYPSNWQRDNYNNKVAFFAPSLEEGDKKIIPEAMFVEVVSLPFQITDVEDY